MLNTKQRILLGAYLVCALNFTALIFFNFDLLDAKGIMDLFGVSAFIISCAVIFDLHRYHKVQRLKQQADTPRRGNTA